MSAYQEVLHDPEASRLAAFQKLLVAKYDPSNPLHMSLVEKALAKLQ